MYPFILIIHFITVHEESQLLLAFDSEAEHTLFLKYLLKTLLTTYCTGRKYVSGLSGLNISLQYITVTRFSVSLKLIILCVYPGNI